MSDISQRRATKKYRSRLAERGMARFEVLGRDTDRELIRSLARRLAEDCRSRQLRTVVSQGGRRPNSTERRFLSPAVAARRRRSYSIRPIESVAGLICEPVSS